MQNNTQNILQHLINLLTNDKLDIFKNTIKRIKSNIKLKSFFNTLADLLVAKNNKIYQIAQKNSFYQECISKIVNFQEINDQILSNQYGNISKEHRDQMIMLNSHIEKQKQNLKYRNQQERQKLIESFKQQQYFIEQQTNKYVQENKELRKQLKETVHLKQQLQKQQLKFQQQFYKITKQVTQLQEKLFQKEKRYYEIKKVKDEKQVTISPSQSFFSNDFSDSLEKVQIFQSQTQNHNNSFQSSFLKNRVIDLSLSKDQKQNKLSGVLMGCLQKIKGRQIKGIKKHFNFHNQKSHNLHTFIDKIPNILLICQVKNNFLIGAFTQSSFQLSIEQQSAKACLFTQFEGNLSLNMIKKGKKSINFDMDLLIFGNKQMCITSKKNQLISHVSKIDAQQRHYECLQQEDYLYRFLSEEKIVLQNYQICQLIFQE